MSEYKGRLIYARGTYTEFVVAPESSVDFGDILVIEGADGDRFYVRAYDFKVKSRWSGMKNVGYLLNKLDANGQVVNEEEFAFYLGGGHTVKVGMAEQLCYAAADGTLYNPRTCPDFFAPVRGLGPDDMSLLSELRGDLEVGYLKSGREVLSLPVGIYGQRAITEHMGVFGTTGSGKSNLVKVLAASVLNNGGYGLLVFDVHNEYRAALRQHPLAAERVVVYNTMPHQEFTRVLGINPWEVTPDDLTACASFTEPQMDALYKIAAVWGQDWLPYMLRYDVADLSDELAGSTGQKFQSRTISKIKSVCWNIKQELNIADGSEHTALRDILRHLEQGRVVLVELKNVSPLGEQALCSLLCKKLLAHYATLAEGEHPLDCPVLVVLEEAHRFLGKKEYAASNIFARLVSEARKFNIGLCAVDQQPRLLADKVLSQLNTLFIMGLASKADRAKLEAMSRKDIAQQRNEIKNLDCGEMVVATNYMRFAAPVKVHKFDDYLQRLA